MVNPRKGGIPEEYEEGRVAFLEVLNELQPDLVIVWGINRLYENLPGKECGWIDGAEFKVDNYSIPNGYYQLNSGKKTKVIAQVVASERAGAQTGGVTASAGVVGPSTTIHGKVRRTVWKVRPQRVTAP